MSFLLRTFQHLYLLNPIVNIPIQTLIFAPWPLLRKMIIAHSLSLGHLWSECLLRALIASSLCSISFSGESISLRRRLRPIWSLCGTGAPTTIIPPPQVSGIFSCFSSQSHSCASEVEKRNLHKMTKLAYRMTVVEWRCLFAKLTMSHCETLM